MAKIPTITSSVSARAGGPSGRLTNTVATAEQFGAGIGRATMNMAKGIDQLGNGLKAMHDSRKAETVASAVALSDFTPREIEIRNDTPANGEGYHQRTVEAYRTYVDEQSQSIEDPIARKEYKNRMLKQTPQVSSRSAVYEATIAAQNSKEQANASLSALTNKVMSDPTLYEEYVQQGEDVLDARPDLTPSAKAGMKQAWRRDSARSRFDGMLRNAQSPEDLEAIALELAGEAGEDIDGNPATDWAKELAPKDYDRLLNEIGTARKAMLTIADTNARSALDTIEDRAKDVDVLISEDELVQVQELVKKSKNPITVARMGRVMRDQEVIKESLQATPADLRTRINGANGNPGIAYPGLPPVLSGAVNEASKRFGVSASYLGGTIHREYGGNLTRKRANIDQKFKPVAVGNHVNLVDVRSDVADAATVAGQLFGAPLQISSGHRSQAHQERIRHKPGADPNRKTVAKKSHHTSGTGLDISTVGMSEADKGRLVGALVDAGFTGIGEYGTHVHGDFRNAVPNSFNAEKGYGGWTNLSPSVVKALQDRGYAPGASASKIRRSAPVTYADDIDFGKPTSVLNSNGMPASTAIGVMQFTDGTFLDVVKTPGMAARIGINIEGKSDAQLLELRKDPTVSVLAGAGLASLNKKTLEASLGRQVSDQELYMAHFLGSGGAMTLISGMEAQDQQSAAALMPKAAASHRGIFYHKGGKARTVGEVYGLISREFGTQPSQVAHADNQTRKRVLAKTEQNLKTDPVNHAQTSGAFNVTPLDVEQGFAARGQEAQSIADYYNIPMDDMKPFTEDEANSLAKKMKDGNADDVLEVMTAIQGMGSKAAGAALRQLDEKDSVMAYAAGLQFNKGQGSVASDIVRGQKRMEENPDIKAQTGAEKSDISDAFMQVTGGALLGAAPKQRQAIMDAALAHYVETVVARGGAGQFDTDAFTSSVQAVLGGKRGAPAIAEVNGAPTVLPEGISGEEMEAALSNMTVDDWIRMSQEDTPPRYVTGDVIAPDDLAEEGRMQAIGGGKYRIVLDDGSFAVTDKPGPNGRLAAYIFQPEPEEIEEIANRPNGQPRNTYGALQDLGASGSWEADVNRAIDDGGAMPVEDQEAMRAQYGALYDFDESGRWLGAN